MKFVPLLALVSLFALGGCSTMEGLKSDISKGFSSIGNSLAEVTDIKAEKKKLPVYDGTCPPVSVRPDLAKLVEFYNDAKPTEATKTSEIKIAGIHNTCRVEKDALVMQVDLTLAGKTGPKARVKASDKPSFAYPYFVAVTDETGTVISKEIFAASISYGANQKEITQVESIFQNMPFPDTEAGKSFNVIVGFQLTEEQLAYNRQNASAAPVTQGPANAQKPILETNR